MELITSALLPVPHAFSTRDGGVSDPPFDTLNVGLSVGDARERVEENLRRLAAAVGVPANRLYTVSQVHGDTVLEAPSDGDGAPVAPIVGEADGVWTARAGAAVGVKTADCVPLLLVDPDGRRVAAVHSGWRGTDQEIAARAVQQLVAQGARAERLLAAIGPHIRVCCYKVGEELAVRFRARFRDPHIVVEEDGAVHLDLERAVTESLANAGVPRAQVDPLPYCTSCDARRFFSHRRDGPKTGRHLALVACAW